MPLISNQQALFKAINKTVDRFIDTRICNEELLNDSNRIIQQWLAYDGELVFPGGGWKDQIIGNDADDYLQTLTNRWFGSEQSMPLFLEDDFDLLPTIFNSQAILIAYITEQGRYWESDEDWNPPEEVYNNSNTTCKFYIYYYLQQHPEILKNKLLAFRLDSQDE